ncbi:hypothetical protein JX265_003009 [Neoarthrinium moseri]|uniref:NAD(P)-binding protein n=1 Tax=Neoarthrinium moseri TaxID=1658444 RepID=A0A9Q0ATN6_9PEZI|nr:uncharacterized protein JN550_006061 [Neoarthrinium moseri]KAI1841962.1 hypothetical protein JX266_011822 [Neoarthrinium moseri]KAI1869074.1 hypothetical protein JN550_006061 [Neoarthrinium moseri]KAI1878832.1 hypothetical protein JX265_003009 [Neoarthrinium moseri]
MSTVLILGAGPNIGLATAKVFATAGYRVAVASRSKPADLDSSYKHFKFDASKPESVPSLFGEVRATLGDPSVVIYNTAQATSTPDGAFTLGLEQFRNDMDVNTTSPYITAQEAIKGFAKTGPGSTFIYTGNKLNVLGWPSLLSCGMGKSAVAHMIRTANIAFPDKGYKFYYVDQRQKDGNVTIPVGGPAHANEFLELAKDAKQRPWHYTFVEGQGYVDFHER